MSRSGHDEVVTVTRLPTTVDDSAVGIIFYDQDSEGYYGGIRDEAGEPDFVAFGGVGGDGGYAMVELDTRVEPLSAALFGTTFTAAFTADTLYAYRCRVRRPFRTTGVQLAFAATVAGDIAAGIYLSADFITWSRGAHSVPMAATANALSTFAFTSPYTLLPGEDYWLAIGSDAGSNTILRLSQSPLATFGGYLAIAKDGVYDDGLPTTFTSVVNVGSTPWYALVGGLPA